MTHRFCGFLLALGLLGCTEAGIESTREQATTPPATAPTAAPTSTQEPPPPTPTAPRPGTGWPMFRGGPALQGRSDAAPSSSPTIAWQVDIEGISGAVPVTSGDGRIYVASWNGLVALDEQGHEQWRFSPGPLSNPWVVHQVALIDDGHIFYIDGDAVSVLDRQGAVLASSAVDLTMAHASYPTVRAGRVYLTTGWPEPVTLHVFDAAAVEVLSSAVGEGELPTPALVTPQGDSWIIGHSSDAHGEAGPGTLFHVDSAGALLDSMPVPPRAEDLMLASDGSILFSAQRPYPAGMSVYRLPPGGQPTRIVDHLGTITSLGLADDDAVLVSHAGGLLKVTLDGEEVYRIDGGAPDPGVFHIWSWSVIAGDGTEIVADPGGRIFGVRQGSVAWQREVPSTPGSWGPNLALSSGGLLIAGTWADRVVAFR
jgi:hypothetical protein